MKLLLDTHVLLWSLSNEKTLSIHTRDVISDPQNLVFVSLVSLWELQIKEAIGKVKLPKDFFQVLKLAGLELLSITLEHIENLRSLPLHHRDPFDRMLVAQAQTEKLTLVTRDQELPLYDVELLKA